MSKPITSEMVRELREKTGVGMMDCKKALGQTGGDLEKAVQYLREKGLAAVAKKSDRSAKEGRVFMAVKGNAGAIVELNCETDFVAGNEAFHALGKQLAEAAVTGKVNAVDAFETTSLGGKSVGDALAEATLKLGEKLAISRVEYLENQGSVASYSHLHGKIGVLISFTGAVAEDLGKDVAMHVAAASPQYVRAEDVPAAEVEKEREIFKVQMANEGKPQQVIDKIVEGKIAKFRKEICLLEQVFVKDPNKSVKQLLPQGVSVDRFVRYTLA